MRRTRQRVGLAASSALREGNRHTEDDDDRTENVEYPNDAEDADDEDDEDPVRPAKRTHRAMFSSPLSDIPTEAGHMDEEDCSETTCCGQNEECGIVSWSERSC